MLGAGVTIDRYQIELLLGEGAMGSVYRALDPRLQRRVALKVLKADAPGAHTSEAAERLLREARAAAAFSHPNAVNVFDAGAVEGSVYVVMEYLQGSTLRDALARPEVPWQTRLAWLTDVARALGAAHQVGIVHRDIKPENVMLTSEGIVKVLDFGIARRAGGPALVDAATAAAGLSTLTEAGALVGTPLYMAPEQLQGAALDGRADQFAWGIMAYEAFAGSRPWGTPGSVYALIAAMLTHEPKPLVGIDSTFPPALSDVVLRALARDPGRRFSSMEALLDALEPATSPAAPLTTTQPLPAPRHASLSPPSSDAVRAFEAARQSLHDGAGHTAERGLERVTALEPAHAAAHLRLALRLLEREAGKAREHYQRAFQFRAALGPRDSAFLHACEPYLRAQPDRAEWERRLSALLEQTADVEVAYWLATALVQQGKHDAAIAVAERAHRVDSSYIPGRCIEAKALIALGRVDQALATLEQGLALSPAAADCLEQRIRVLVELGQCARVEADAKAWVAIEPESPLALYALAEALASRAAPYESIEAVLARRWRLAGSQHEAEDRLDLALYRGDFADAEQLLLAWCSRAALTATGVIESFHPTLGLLSVYTETGRLEQAADAAATCLARLQALSADPLGSDPSLRLLRHMFRGGRLTRDEYVKRRAAWLAERKSSHGLSVADWLNGYVTSIDSEDEAREAVAAARDFPALPPAPWPSHLATLIGKLHVLTGDPSSGDPLLQRAACTCSILSGPVIHATANYYLGLALRDLRDLAGARRAFEVVVARWGHASPESLTAARSRAELAKLGP